MPDTIPLTSVHTIHGTNKSAAFTHGTSEVFKDRHNIAPVFISERMKYVTWEADSNMHETSRTFLFQDETLSRREKALFV